MSLIVEAGYKSATKCVRVRERTMPKVFIAGVSAI